MIATTFEYQKLQDWRPKRLYCHLRLSVVVVAIARDQFLPAGPGLKPQICRSNCHSICHSSTDINISGFGGYIATSGCRSLSQSVGDTIRAGRGRKSLTWRWDFDAIGYNSNGITISGFGGHIAVSGHRSML